MSNPTYDELFLGSTPCSEPCAQVGEANYALQSRAELIAYRNQIKRLLAKHGKTLPDEANFKLIIKGNVHDFGTYYDLVIKYNEDDKMAANLAFWVDENNPSEWDAEAREELGLPAEV